MIKYNMIQKFDTEGFTDVFQLFCDLDIFPAWCKSACRLVVVIMKKSAREQALDIPLK